MIYLAEITAYDPALPGVRVLRYSSGAGYSSPGAPGYYAPRIKQPASFRRDAFDAGRTRRRGEEGANVTAEDAVNTGGGSRIGWGALVLANDDGLLDGIRDWGLDGRPFTLLGLESERAAYGDAVTILSGTMEQPVCSLDEVTIRLRDRQEELDGPIQTAKFAGDNVLPLGVEGGADLKGKPLPLCYGEAWNVPPPCANTAKLVYVLHDGPIEDVVAVRDGGSALTRGVARASIADLLANDPGPTLYDYFLGAAGQRACIRLGSQPIYQLTVDLKGDKSGGSYWTTAADIWREIVTRRGGIAAGDVSEADIDDLNAANGATVGIWIGGEANIRATLDLLAGSVGAWWGVDRTGSFRIRRLEVPAGTAAATFRFFDQTTATVATDADIVTVRTAASNDAGRGIPAWRVLVAYKPVWQTQTADQLTGAAQAYVSFVGAAWRTEVAEDATVKIKHQLAEQLAVQSLMVGQSAATAEAARLLALYKDRRDRLTLTTPLDTTLAATVDLGAVVEVVMGRFGYEPGRKMIVTGMQYDAAGEVVELDLWG